ncbi:hypothetical protein GW17_00060178, partial [Ensete ventricosum]
EQAIGILAMVTEVDGGSGRWPLEVLAIESSPLPCEKRMWLPKKEDRVVRSEKQEKIISLKRERGRDGVGKVSLLIGADATVVGYKEDDLV